MNELWNAVPGGGQEVKAKAAVLKKYRKGYEGIFQGLSYCLKYGEKDDQAPRIALFPLFLASPALDHGVDSKVRHPEWVEFIRSVKSNRGTAVRQRCCCCCQLVIPLGLIPPSLPQVLETLLKSLKTRAGHGGYRHVSSSGYGGSPSRPASAGSGSGTPRTTRLRNSCPSWELDPTYQVPRLAS